MSIRRWPYALLLLTGLIGAACGDSPSKSGTQPKTPGTPPSDIDKVERLLAARKEYQTALEDLRGIWRLKREGY